MSNPVNPFSSWSNLSWTMVAFVLLKLCWAIFLSLLLWPFFILFTLINELVRLILILVLRKGRYKLLCRGADDFFNSDTGFHTNTVLLALFSPDQVDIGNERKLWAERVLDNKEEKGDKLTYSRLKQTLCTRFGYGCWRDDSETFDIQDHVKEYDYTKPKNGEGFWTEDELVSTIIPRLSEPMTSTDKPQWEWIIIPNVLDHYGTVKSVRILRYHHSYMDGVFLGLLLGECLFDKWKDGGRPPFILDPKGTKLNGNMERALFFARFLTILMAPLIVVQGSLTKPHKYTNDPFITRKTTGKRYYMYSEPIDTLTIKKIGENAGKKNSPQVCASVFQKSFQKMLERRCQHCRRKDTVIKMNVTQAIPPLKSSRPRNQFTVMLSQLCLLPNEQEWVDLCMGPDLLFPYLYIRWAGRMPKWMLRKVPKAGPSSVTFTNSPFLKVEGRIGGNRIESVAGWTIIVKPMGIGLTSIGYGDKVRFTIAAEEGCVTEEEAKRFLIDANEIVQEMAKDKNANQAYEKADMCVQVDMCIVHSKNRNSIMGNVTTPLCEPGCTCLRSSGYWRINV